MCGGAQGFNGNGNVICLLSEEAGSWLLPAPQGFLPDGSRGLAPWVPPAAPRPLLGLGRPIRPGWRDWCSARGSIPVSHFLLSLHPVLLGRGLPGQEPVCKAWGTGAAPGPPLGPFTTLPGPGAGQHSDRGKGAATSLPHWAGRAHCVVSPLLCRAVGEGTHVRQYVRTRVRGRV